MYQLHPSLCLPRFSAARAAQDQDPFERGTARRFLIEERAAQQRLEASKARANATGDAEILAAEEKERESFSHHVWATEKHIEAVVALTAKLDAERAAAAEHNRSLEAEIKEIKDASPGKQNVPSTVESPSNVTPTREDARAEQPSLAHRLSPAPAILRSFSRSRAA